MTTKRQDITGDDLHGYVDGQLAPDRRLEVEAWLSDNPDAAETVRVWIAQNEAIRDAFPLEQARATDPSMLVLAAPRRTPFMLLAASITAALAVGAIAGYGLGRIEPHRQQIAGAESFAKASLANYLVYSGEIRHPVEVSASDKDHLVAWLGKRIGGQLHAPDLTAEGFDLVGGRLTTFGDQPGAMLMYQDTAGARLTMLTARNQDNTTTGFRFASDNGVDTFYWIDGPFGFAISGTVGRAKLESLANAIYAQIDN